MSIQERRLLANQAIRDAEGELVIARAKLAAVQASCAHPNAKEWTHYDYSGGSSREFECPDCGKRSSH